MLPMGELTPAQQRWSSTFAAGGTGVVVDSGVRVS